MDAACIMEIIIKKKKIFDLFTVSSELAVIFCILRDKNMDDVLKKAVYLLGIIAAIYIAVAFVLPFLWTVLAFLLKVIFFTALILAVVAALGYSVIFLLRFFEK